MAVTQNYERSLLKPQIFQQLASKVARVARKKSQLQSLASQM